MEETYITYETGMLAKEKQFSEYVTHYYDLYKNGRQKKILLVEGWENDENGYGAKEWDWNLIKHDKLPYPIDSALCSAPSQSQLHKWLREKEIYVDVVTVFYKDPNEAVYRVRVSQNINNCEKLGRHYFASDFKVYEDALEEGLRKGLECLL